MLNSTTWLYGAEVLPITIRSKIMGLAAASHFVVNVGRMYFLLAMLLISLAVYVCMSSGRRLTENNCCTVTEAGPSAFANIKENYYYVFVGCTVVFFIIAYFYFP